jgi:hypothetical protein
MDNNSYINPHYCVCQVQVDPGKVTYAECHIEGILIDSEPIPVSTGIENHKDNPDFKDGIWALIEVDLSKLSLKSKRVNITMPERLLNSLDYFARKRGETRSGVLTKAATEYMSSHQ